MYQIVARKPGQLVVKYASQMSTALETFTRLEADGFKVDMSHVTPASRSYPHNIEHNHG